MACAPDDLPANRTGPMIASKARFGRAPRRQRLVPVRSGSALTPLRGEPKRLEKSYKFAENYPEFFPAESASDPGLPRLAQ